VTAETPATLTDASTFDPLVLAVTVDVEPPPAAFGSCGTLDVEPPLHAASAPITRNELIRTRHAAWDVLKKLAFQRNDKRNTKSRLTNTTRTF
jgi:hypothetical protein